LSNRNRENQFNYVDTSLQIEIERGQVDFTLIAIHQMLFSHWFPTIHPRKT